MDAAQTTAAAYMADYDKPRSPQKTLRAPAYGNYAAELSAKLCKA